MTLLCQGKQQFEFVEQGRNLWVSSATVPGGRTAFNDGAPWCSIAHSIIVSIDFI